MNISIIGTGYVGLTLALALSKVRHKISCFDINNKLIENLRRGLTDIKEPFIDEYIKNGIKNKNLFFYSPKDFEKYSEIVFVTVGSNIIAGSSEIYKKRIFDILIKCVKNNVKFVFLRSTISIGFSNTLKEKFGNKLNIIYAPERTIEGNAIGELFNLPQIIACKNVESRKIAQEIFKELDVDLIFTENYEEAELAKLICNTYRDYNFAFSNQIALLCKKLSIDLSKVNDLASNKYKRLPILKPGPVSGPCLSKDVHILSDSFESNKDCKLLLNAREINNKVLDVALADIIGISKRFKLKDILIMGLGFKSEPPVGDTRDSHSLYLAKMLQKDKYNLFFYDPIVDSAGKEYMKGREIINNLDVNIDLIVFPIIPYWYYEGDSIFQKYINVKRYWLYKPKILPEFGDDFIFGEYENSSYL